MIDVSDPVALRTEAERRQRLRAKGQSFADSNAVALADVDDDALEDVHVAEGEKLLRACGWEIVRNSVKKRQKVTPGIPDRKCYHRRLRLTFWWEAKASWGRQSPAQREFQLMAEAVGEFYVLGQYEALVQWLVTQQLGAVVGGAFEPNP